MKWVIASMIIVPTTFLWFGALMIAVHGPMWAQVVTWLELPVMLLAFFALLRMTLDE